MTLPDLDPDAFWSLVDRSAGAGRCWLWTGPTNCDGYGLVSVRGRMERAHRVAWLLAGHDLSEQVTLDHVCITYRCCNDWHLTPLSRAMHARRGRERGRFDVLRPAPILDEHARRVAAHLQHHGPTELVVLADTLEIPVRTLRKQHMADRVQARYGVRRHRHGGRVVFHPPAAGRGLRRDRRAAAAKPEQGRGRRPPEGERPHASSSAPDRRARGRARRSEGRPAPHPCERGAPPRAARRRDACARGGSAAGRRGDASARDDRRSERNSVAEGASSDGGL